MANGLGREEWLRAARLALLKGGVGEVHVERLARYLRITKGSFYWHFKDRDELLNVLLHEWEVELRQQIIPRLRGKRGREGLHLLVRLMIDRVPLSEEGILPSDAAMFTWASVSPAIARRVNRAERKRIELLKKVIGAPDLAELLYLVWLGFVARRQRLPNLRNQFSQIGRAMLGLCQSHELGRDTRRATRRSEAGVLKPSETIAHTGCVCK